VAGFMFDTRIQDPGLRFDAGIIAGFQKREEQLTHSETATTDIQDAMMLAESQSNEPSEE
jgi:hypothetical protein